MSIKCFYFYHLELPDGQVEKFFENADHVYRVVAGRELDENLALLSQKENAIVCAEVEDRPYEIQEGVVRQPNWLEKCWEIEKYADKVFSKVEPGDDVLLFLLDNPYDLSMYNSFRTRKISHSFHVHVLLFCAFLPREGNETFAPRLLPYYWEADSIRIFNICNFAELEKDVYLPVRFMEGSVQLWRDKEAQEAIAFFAEQAKEEMRDIPFSDLHCDVNHIYFWKEQEGKYILLDRDPAEFANAILEDRDLFTVIPPPKNGREQCHVLRTYRKNYAKKHHVKFEEYACMYKGECKGTCQYCEQEAESLFRKAEKLPSRIEKLSPLTAQIAGIMRLRENVDGPGIRSLVVFDGCPLHCEYCINRDTIRLLPTKMTLDAERLGHLLMEDAVYFEMTGGGVTFGGGEPLQYYGFISQFHEMYPMWDIAIETSLNLPLKNVKSLASKINHWYIDIKDMDSDIYYCYTGSDNGQVIVNLQYLIDSGFRDRITCRVPLIPGYNTKEDVEQSVSYLKWMGITHFDCFTYTVC